MKRATQVLYGLVAIGTIVLGGAAILGPGLVLPPAASSPLVAHLTREQGAEFVFIGLMSVWCLRHYEARRPVHYAFVVLAALFAGIHWAGYLESGEYIAGALVNTVPFAAFAVTAPGAKGS
jgi:hypothetical protein